MAARDRAPRLCGEDVLLHEDGLRGTGDGYEPSSRHAGPVPIPKSLVSGSAPLHRYEHVILGAGCAGLSLCYYLLEQGVEEPILILDRRSGFEDDRTWCFWDVEETPFSGLAVRSWSSWRFRTGKREIMQTSAEHPYLCLTGADFYRNVLACIAARDNVTLRLGQEILGYEESSDETRVETTGETYSARHVFDARGLPPDSEAAAEARRRSAWVPQKFLGLRVRTREPVFDPVSCTLMDFSVSQARGLRFAYVLPFGEKEALVENVYLSEAEVSAEEHRAEVSGYLRDRYGLSTGDYVVDGEERGYVPMTDHRFPRRMGERTYAVGMLGGETRPSTGYTFLRIQRYCRSLARSIAVGSTVPEHSEPRRLGLLDGIFLRFMREHPERCPEVYHRMFAGVAPGPLVRFLTEKSTPADELRLVMALPKTPFLRVAARMLLDARPTTVR